MICYTYSSEILDSMQYTDLKIRSINLIYVILVIIAKQALINMSYTLISKWGRIFCGLIY
jgi:hypothetical protein